MKSLEQKLEEPRGSDKKVKELESKVNILERSIGRKGGIEISEDREERRRNIAIKGLRLEGKELKDGVEEIFKRIETKVEVEAVRKIGKEGRRGEGIALVKLKNMEHKREVMRKKRSLYGRSERIEHDLTWGERKMQYRLREIAGEEREKGNKSWVKNGKIQIEGIWWEWDEGRKMLVSGRGEEWMKSRQEENVERNEQGE